MFRKFMCLCAILVLVACAPVPGVMTSPLESPLNPPQADLDPLNKTEWVLINLLGQSLQPGTRITLEFRNEYLSGHGGCNWYQSPYTADESKLTASEVVATSMACFSPPGVMDQETRYARALQAVSSYHIVDEMLYLGNAAGDAMLTFRHRARAAMNPADLIGVTWQLTLLNGEPPIAGSRTILRFTSSTAVEGSTDCRSYEGTYEAEDDDIRWAGLEIQAVACDDPALQRLAYQYVNAFTAAMLTGSLTGS